MDGYQVCNTLKEDQKASHIPIILLTDTADMDSKFEELQYGPDAYLSKPFNRKELLARIKSLLDQRQRIQNHYQRLYGIDDENTSGARHQFLCQSQKICSLIKSKPPSISI